MAYSYPYYYPSRRYPSYNYSYNYNHSKYCQPVYSQNAKEDIKNKIPLQNEQTPKVDSCNSNLDNESRELFEIFGIKLFFDDILLICLIFFLYNEGVKDQYLFISLILLLLS